MFLTDREIEEKLAEYKPCFHRLARKFSSFNEDDLVQEAMLAVWKELKKYEEGPYPVDVFIVRRANWRMTDIASGKSSWTAQNPKRKYREKYTEVCSAEFYDHAAPDQIEDSDFRIYLKDITTAMREHLTEKQRTHMVMENVHFARRIDMIEKFGYYPYNSISSSTKLKMQKSLSHLESMVK